MTAQKKEEKPSYESLLETSTREGISAGIMVFLLKNRVKLTPTHKCEYPLKSFISRILHEFNPDPEGYPFDESIKDHILTRLSEVCRIVDGLYDEGKLDIMVNLLHCETAEGTAEFLEARREETLKLIRTIRGD